MPEVNYEWVRQQLQEARVKVGSGNAVLQLLEIWEKQTKLSPNLAKEAIEVFSKLALGYALSEQTADTEEVWVPLQPGQIRVGDEVRVLKDAFTDEAGTIHNGRRGKVVAVRYGDVIFTATDNKEPKLNGVHYSPYKMEKRVK
jgi:transcription antitermination factor NusG